MMKELDISKVTSMETTELWIQGELNLIYARSRFINMCFPMTSQPETSESAKKAILDTAYNLAVSASEIYCKLRNVYNLPE